MSRIYAKGNQKHWSSQHHFRRKEEINNISRWDANYHYDNEKEAQPARPRRQGPGGWLSRQRPRQHRRAGRPPKAKAGGVAAKARAKVASAGKAERERLSQTPLTARAKAAVAKAKACATVAGMRALSLCSPLDNSESEPMLQPRSEALRSKLRPRHQLPNHLQK